MSGVEAAGFVLAAFPLIISALQSYRESLEPLNDWWHYRTRFLKFNNAVKIQCDIFDENIEMLLGPIVSSDSEMASLLSDPGGPKWQQPDLAKKLEQRLPKSYGGYMRTIVEMNETLEKLKTKLGIVEDRVSLASQDV
jgi:hypothetical protein